MRYILRTWTDRTPIIITLTSAEMLNAIGMSVVVRASLKEYVIEVQEATNIFRDDHFTVEVIDVETFITNTNLSIINALRARDV